MNQSFKHILVTEKKCLQEGLHCPTSAEFDGEAAGGVEYSAEWHKGNKTVEQRPREGVKGGGGWNGGWDRLGRDGIGGGGLHLTLFSGMAALHEAVWICASYLTGWKAGVLHRVRGKIFPYPEETFSLDHWVQLYQHRLGMDCEMVCIVFFGHCLYTSTAFHCIRCQCWEHKIMTKMIKWKK